MAVCVSKEMVHSYVTVYRGIKGRAATVSIAIIKLQATQLHEHPVNAPVGEKQTRFHIKFLLYGLKFFSD